jgi:hypothetical protein
MCRALINNLKHVGLLSKSEIKTKHSYHMIYLACMLMQLKVNTTSRTRHGR